MANEYAAYAALTDAVFVIDEAGGIRYRNGACAGLVGDTIDAVLLFQGGAVEWLELLGKIQAHGRWRGAAERRGGDGIERLDCVLSALPDGRFVLVGRRRATSAPGPMQQMSAIGELVRVVAHDLNNILTGVIGYADLVLNSQALTSDDREDTTHIRRGAKRAAELADHLIAFSKKQSIQLASLHLPTLVEGIAADLQQCLGAGIDLQISAEPGVGPVEGEARQIERVLLALADNARDAMGSGEGVFSVAVTARDAQVLITVEDTGEGMGPETLARAFEPLFGTRGRDGLGLATASAIMQQHGGTVEARSTVGDGTAVELWFPRGADAATLPPLPAPLDRRAEVVLVVDDERLVRVLARRLLSDLGYGVIEAESAEHALNIASNAGTHIDLVLTDVVMPGMHGQALLDAVSALRPGIGGLFMSGYARETIAHRGGLAPGASLLQKPFTAKTLFHAVRKALDLRHQDSL